MKKFTVIALYLASSAAFACPIEIAKTKALQAGLFLEGLNGGTPLTFGVEPTEKRVDTWIVTLSYSGVQREYYVGVDSRFCRITDIVTHH